MSEYRWSAFAVALSLLCTALIASTNPVSAAEPTIGQVSRLDGEVILRRAGSDHPVSIGTAVREGDRLHTGSRSGCAVDFVDGARLTVGPGTQAEISRYTLATDDGRVVLILRGIVRALTGSGGAQGFDLVTPTAIAAARSTDWLVDVEAHSTGVFVRSGVVTVLVRAPSSGAPADRIELMAGEGTDVPLGGPATPARAWGAGRVTDAHERLSLPLPQ